MRTIVRVVDTFTIPQEELPREIESSVGVHFSVFVLLKSGAAQGKYEIRFVLNPPTKAPREIGAPQFVFFNGGEHGVTITLVLGVGTREVGVFGIDVVVDGERLTTIPFRLRRAEPESREPRRSSST